MTESLISGVLKDAITTALTVAAPMLIVAVVIGLIISILQATTQIHEQTLTFLPKLIGMAIIGIMTGSWMLHKLTAFTERIFDIISKITS
ncbi:flagellar biosynthesis protein FliQ [Clostridium sp. MSJ-8]|jgi:flagellar biosynthetic protein FliQ|uniref:flagellar biosynthesis protein FliQ n=1 Tax=Clostridium sp. MSJ-8 TaxID=2841510 RepID=UPI001C0EA470|nr:flagellar biosynthesis protein FliQ [Clostridium sp. MSJ-8]MBU5488387.1 flagellar biosynthesis protein FliQ [Clostridium sp. MSJ-8]